MILTFWSSVGVFVDFSFMISYYVRKIVAGSREKKNYDDTFKRGFPKDLKTLSSSLHVKISNQDLEPLVQRNF